MARLRFVGSPWVRRVGYADRGPDRREAQPHGAVGTSVISTENRTDLGYESPPGVLESTARRGGDVQTLGTQINEKSLRILGTDLRLGERAEAYLRFPAGAQNLLTYRDAPRLDARPRARVGGRRPAGVPQAGER